MKEYKELLATDAKTDLQKALLTRNFFLQGTQGTFNPLFAGECFSQREAERGGEGGGKKLS